MKLRLAQLETRLQGMIEGSAARLFAGRSPTGLAFQLVEAMRVGIRHVPGDGDIAPDLFILLVHPDQAGVLQSDFTLLEDLTFSLQEAGMAANLRFLNPPDVRVVAAPELALGEIKVAALHSWENLPSTAAMEVEREDGGIKVPQGAFLIVNGTRIFQLQQSVVNIGRKDDNHLVLDDPHISRQHAQIRVMRGHLVIFDLDSTGGTWVNGERVEQRRLFPGDVIFISGIPLVFGLEPGAQEYTIEYAPSS